MSTTVFPFRMSVRTERYEEWRDPRHVVTEAENGKEFVLALDAAARLVASGAVVLSGATDHAYSDWEDFHAALDYGADSCLYQCHRAAFREVADEALGTHSGGAGVDFALDSKFVEADTLVVEVAGVRQVLTTDYTFSGNNSAPKITSTANLDSGAVVASYRFYHQVRVRQTGGPLYRRDVSLGTQRICFVPVEIREAIPGGHLV